MQSNKLFIYVPLGIWALVFLLSGLAICYQSGFNLALSLIAVVGLGKAACAQIGVFLLLHGEPRNKAVTTQEALRALMKQQSIVGAMTRAIASRQQQGRGDREVSARRGDDV